MRNGVVLFFIPNLQKLSPKENLLKPKPFEFYQIYSMHRNCDFSIFEMKYIEIQLPPILLSYSKYLEKCNIIHINPSINVITLSYLEKATPPTHP